jgi:hypothetical protein
MDFLHSALLVLTLGVATAIVLPFFFLGLVVAAIL